MRSWQEAALFNTTEIVATSTEESWTGTGFFVQADKKLFLVSNRHVLENNPDAHYSITVHKISELPTSVTLELGNVKIYIDYENPFNINFKTEFGYTAHPDPGIDLALIDLTAIANPLGSIIIPFSPNKILDWNASVLTPTDKIMFVGYPDSISDALHHLPVVRTGTIASLPMLNFNGEPIFLIDAQIWPGSSGSPVYVSAEKSGENFSVVGVIRSTIPTNDDETKLLGLGHAIKSSELLKLLSHALKPIV